MQQMIGFTDAKRKVAISLGVDPYSSNEALQHVLDEISWASFAGGMVFTVETMPIGGGVGAALTATQVTGNPIPIALLSSVRNWTPSKRSSH